MLHGAPSEGSKGAKTSLYKRATELVALHKRATELFRSGDGIALSQLLKHEGFASISQVSTAILDIFDEIKELGIETQAGQLDTTCSKCFGFGFVPKVEYLREEGFVTPNVQFGVCECQASVSKGTPSTL